MTWRMYENQSDCARWPPRRVSRNLFSPERPDKRESYLQRVPSVRRYHSHPMKTVAHPSHTWLAAGETLHAVYILPLSTCDEDGHRALNGHARIRLPWKTYVQMSATKGGGYSAITSRTGLFLNAPTNTRGKCKSCIHFFTFKESVFSNLLVRIRVFLPNKSRS